MRQMMLILPAKGRRLPSANALKKAGFLVSAAVDRRPAQDRTDSGQASTTEERTDQEGNKTSR